MNCLLQFFLHNRIIIQWLIFHKCNYSGDIPGCLLCELQKLLKKFYDPLRTCIPAPSDIFTVMLNRRPEFLATAHLQHDVQEVFSWLIQDISSQEDRHSQTFSKLFYGNIQSLLKCENCNKKQIHYESCFNFFLPYPDSNASMIDCLAEFLEDVSCSVVCKSCNQKCSKIFPSKFISLPQIFVLAISPFNTSKKRVVKTTTKIAIEKEIDISAFISTAIDDEFPSTSKEAAAEEIFSLKSLKRRRGDVDRDDEYLYAEEKSIKRLFIPSSDMMIDAARATTLTPDSDGDSGLGNENCSPPSLEPSDLQPTTPHHHRSHKNKQKIAAIKNTKYKLEGIIYHRGDEKGGHYYAKVINHMSSSTTIKEEDEWIECNDTKVSHTSINDSQCDDQPYLFFYCLNNNNNNV
uniref:USP domain-containing protein n=1 Tax=Panagrolaimus superbus TaxID=310955 RepID=A0A914Z0N5_9BILA